MYSKNISTFLLNMTKDGQLNLNLDDEIIRDTRVTQGGEVVNPRIREILGLSPLDQPEPEDPAADEAAPQGVPQ